MLNSGDVFVAAHRGRVGWGIGFGISVSERASAPSVPGFYFISLALVLLFSPSAAGPVEIAPTCELLQEWSPERGNVLGKHNMFLPLYDFTKSEAPCFPVVEHTGERVQRRRFLKETTDTSPAKQQ